MLGDNDKTKAQLLDEVQKLRRCVDELERSNAEHEQAAAALKTSEARFRAIHEYAPLMMDAFDKDGRCILWNRECERVFGWTMAELNAHGDPLSLFYPDPQIREEVIQSVTETPGETFREWHPLTKDGSERITLWANFQLPDGTVINLGQDISERRRAEEKLTAYREHLEQLVDERTTELREVNANLSQEITERQHAEGERLKLERQVQHAQKLESLGVMAGGIAHDFNNLLCVILGSAELALDSLSDVSPARPLIEDAESAARRAAELTRQMLAYSGRGRFEARELNLSELAEEMAQLIKSSISKNVEIEMNLQTRLPGVRADVAQLQQVVMNLATNAAEAVGEEENGSVKVSTGTMHCSRRYLNRSRSPERPDEGEFAYIEVVDSGCGMNEEAKEKLFDPFFTTKFMGRGLGMSAVLGIVRSHNGAIIVDSEPGEGTSIRVLLPALEESRIPSSV